MPSGFLILPDGRCFSRRTSAHDAVLLAVAEELNRHEATRSLRQWVLDLLPGPEDTPEIGIGAWVRAADNEVVRRFLDLRRMTTENQEAFCEAAKRALKNSRPEPWLGDCLTDLADMIVRCEKGEPPLSTSDWREVVPPERGLIGPDEKPM
jgi:hypothetical protein